VDLVRSASGKVLVVGVGTSGPVARRMAHVLATSGTPSLYMHPVDALHGSLGAVAEGDVVIAISKGGRSTELDDFATLAKARGAAVLCLTAETASPLARLSDLAVLIPQTQAADPGGVTAMGSSLAVAAWGDALAVVLMQLSGYSWTQVLEAHPSGAVGQHRPPGSDAAPTRGAHAEEGQQG
jgi:arabinose-5-phosphate isomerase